MSSSSGNNGPINGLNPVQLQSWLENLSQQLNPYSLADQTDLLCPEVAGLRNDITIVNGLLAYAKNGNNPSISTSDGYIDFSFDPMANSYAAKKYCNVLLLEGGNEAPLPIDKGDVFVKIKQTGFSLVSRLDQNVTLDPKTMVDGAVMVQCDSDQLNSGYITASWLQAGEVVTQDICMDSNLFLLPPVGQSSTDAALLRVMTDNCHFTRDSDQFSLYWSAADQRCAATYSRSQLSSTFLKLLPSYYSDNNCSTNPALLDEIVNITAKESVPYLRINDPAFATEPNPEDSFQNLWARTFREVNGASATPLPVKDGLADLPSLTASLAEARQALAQFWRDNNASATYSNNQRAIAPTLLRRCDLLEVFAAFIGSLKAPLSIDATVHLNLDNNVVSLALGPKPIKALPPGGSQALTASQSSHATVSTLEKSKVLIGPPGTSLV